MDSIEKWSEENPVGTQLRLIRGKISCEVVSKAFVPPAPLSVLVSIDGAIHAVPVDVLEVPLHVLPNVRGEAAARKTPIQFEGFSPSPLRGCSASLALPSTGQSAIQGKG